MHTLRRDEPAAYHLDAIRGAAALLVAAGHVRLLLVKNTADLTIRLTLGRRLFYFLTQLGNLSVMVFFVLSGYLIGSSVLSALQKGRWTWGGYAQARLSRLLVVLVPALLIGGLIDAIGLKILSSSIVYSTPFYGALLPHSLISQLTAKTFLGNLFFLQTIFVPTFGSNHALWSLSNEFWYYVVFPLAALSVFPATRPTVRLAFAALAVAILCIMPRDMAVLFTVWLLGVGVAITPRRTVPAWATRVVCCVLVVTLLAAALDKLPLVRHIVGVLCAVWFYCIINMAPKPVPAPYARASTFLSRISYTLYLTHTPFVVFAAAMIIGRGPKYDPDARGISMTILLTAVAVLYAGLMWWLFERNTPRVRDFFSGRRQGTQASVEKNAPAPLAGSVSPDPS